MIGEFFGYVLGNRWAKRRERQAAAKLHERGRANLSVRVVQGRLNGVGREWLAGEWRVEGGRLLLASVDIAVSAIVGQSRHPTWRELHSLDSDSLVVALVSEGARLELAINEGEIGWLTSRLNVARLPN